MNDNLEKLNNSRTPEERREAAKKASAASVEKRRKLRTWRESAEMIMGCRLSAAEAKALFNKVKLPADVDLTQLDAITAALTTKAKRGDVEAAKMLRGSMGQDPAQLIKVGNAEDKPFELLDLKSMTDSELRKLAERERPDDDDT